MMKLFSFSFLLFSLFFQEVNAQSHDISIIPEPAYIADGKGEFVLNKQTVIIAPLGDTALNQLAQMFVQWITPATGFDLKIKNKAGSSEKTNKVGIKKFTKGWKRSESQGT